MPYNINLTNGSLLVTVQDGTADALSSSIALFGKNYAGYGEILNENQIKIMENFANATAPLSPLQGQLWWDTAQKRLKVRKGTEWKIVGAPTPSATAPVASTESGDLWLDTTTDQLKVFTGTAWQNVGPAYTSAQGLSGAIVETVTLGDTTTRDVVKVVSNGEITAVLSNYAEFTYTGYAGLTTIKPGINLPAVGSKKFVGTSTDSDALGGVAAVNYARTDQNETFTGAIHINNNDGLTIGTSSTLKAKVLNTDSTIENTVNGGNLNLNVTVVGAPTTAIGISGNTGLVTLVGDPVASLGAATKQYVDNSIATAGNTYVKANGSVTVDGSILPTLMDTVVLGGNSNRFLEAYVRTVNAETLNVDVVNSPRLVNSTVEGSLLPINHLSYDIGSASLAFRNLYVQTTVTVGADIAEKYTSDSEYEPGTVLDFGGTEEVTLSTEDASKKVAGVVSFTPATVMNNECPGLTVTLALVGRVPVNVVGPVKKGDMLVSAGAGRARAEENPATGTVIGKAITEVGPGPGQVVALVGRH